MAAKKEAEEEKRRAEAQKLAQEEQARRAEVAALESETVRIAGLLSPPRKAGQIGKIW